MTDHTLDETVAFAHALDPALRDLDVEAHKPVQGEAMHKVLGYAARRALRQVGWSAPDGLRPIGDAVSWTPRDWVPVYVVEDPDARPVTVVVRRDSGRVDRYEVARDIRPADGGRTGPAGDGAD